MQLINSWPQRKWHREVDVAVSQPHIQQFEPRGSGSGRGRGSQIWQMPNSRSSRTPFGLTNRPAGKCGTASYLVPRALFIVAPPSPSPSQSTSASPLPFAQFALISAAGAELSLRLPAESAIPPSFSPPLSLSLLLSLSLRSCSASCLRPKPA